MPLLHLLPRKVGSGPVLANRTTIDRLPQLKSWPDDGGAFITLPQVYTESAARPGFRHSNLGMYRVQLSGNSYRPNEEVGIHYQIHRGIGVHHAEAIERNVPFRVNIFVGGPPVSCQSRRSCRSRKGCRNSPLPVFSPVGGYRWSAARASCRSRPRPISASSGTIDPDKTLPEGPFGDHLGYYSLVHDFPVLKVENVFHRPDAIWPFTSVGRPPQEDTSFGAFIHELTAPLISTVLPGVDAVHAVDAAGVHPLLLAAGTNATPPMRPNGSRMELLTIANAILGQGQLSLAKYLWIFAREDNPGLDIHDIPAFFRHMLERVDWRRDLHFQTRTTIDTLDYSGEGLNRGSKVVIAAAGPKRRDLADRTSRRPAPARRFR